MSLSDDDIQKAKDILSESGDLSWMYSEEQMKMHRLLNRVKKPQKLCVLNVARQTGKTFWAVAEAISWAIKKPGSMIYYASSRKKNLDHFVLPAFSKILDMLPKEIRPKFVSDKYKFDNGSIITTIGLDLVPDGGRGNTIDFYVFEEAGFIDKLDYIASNVVFPATRRRPDAKILMISTPSQSPDHPFREYCTKAAAGGYYLCMPVTKTSATDEQIEQYKDECLTYTDFLREYMCEFVTDETLAVVPELDNAKLAAIQPSELTPRPNFFTPFVCGDLGYYDHTAFLFGYYDFKLRKIIIEAEWSCNRKTTEYIAESVKDIEKKLWGEKSVPVRYVDGSALSIGDLNAVHNFSCALPRKVDLIGRINALREVIKREEIIFSPSLKITPAHCKGALWANAQKTKFSRAKGHHYDALAALVYFVESINKYDDPEPWGFGYHEGSMYWRNYNNSPDHKEDEVIKNIFT